MYSASWLSLEIKFLLNKRIYHYIWQVKLYKSWIKTNRQTKVLFVSQPQYTNFHFFSSLLPIHTLENNNTKVKNFDEPVLRSLTLRLSKIHQNRLIAFLLLCFPHHKVFSILDIFCYPPKSPMLPFLKRNLQFRGVKRGKRCRGLQETVEVQKII